MSEAKKDDEIVKLGMGPTIGDTTMAEYELADGRTGYGKVRAPKDGEPLNPGERMLWVDKRGEDGRHPVKELYRVGPAQVASAAYRTNYDAIFGKKEVN